MKNFNIQSLDPKLDLSFERVIDVPRELVWKTWTTPEHLKPWFCPLPWRTIDCRIDLRPGGEFSTVLLSPEGREYPGHGCYLEVVENEKLTWTNALTPGFRPAPGVSAPNEEMDAFYFTASIQLATQGTGTLYIATAMHGDEASCAKHSRLGFHEGWGIALDQMVAYIKQMQAA
ncbi:MAG TPA: SRPBCC family protein [Gallionella sp.]